MSDLLIALAEMIAKAAAAKKTQRTSAVVPPPLSRAGAKPQAALGRQKIVAKQVRRQVAPQAKAVAPQTRRTEALKTSAAPATATHARDVSPDITQFLRPKALRSQFILTEIFQPPVALRPERF